MKWYKKIQLKVQVSGISCQFEECDLRRVCVCVCVMQDGFLDAGEVANWILPGEVDHADNEAKHLIHETDTDKVNKRGQKHHTVHKQSAWFQTDGKKKNFNNPPREDDLLQQQHHKKKQTLDIKVWENKLRQSSPSQDFTVSIYLFFLRCGITVFSSRGQPGLNVF